jgi:Protein of unknown function (DUF1402)
MDDQKIALLGSIPYSGKPPWQPRQGASVQEDQRVKAIQLIRDNSNLIKVMAGKYNIPPESIAGAILWEAVENPYPAWRYSQPGVPAHQKLPGVLGKIHADQWFYAHGNQKIPRTSDYLPTVANLNKTKVAIEYIAALMDIHAANYEQIVGLNVRKSPGILTTLYHGGDSYGRAVDLRDKRYRDRQHGRSPRLPSVPEKEMGEYVEKYQKYVRTDLLNLNDLGLNELSLNRTQDFDVNNVQEFDLTLNPSNDALTNNTQANVDTFNSLSRVRQGLETGVAAKQSSKHQTGNADLDKALVILDRMKQDYSESANKQNTTPEPTVASSRRNREIGE